MKEKITFLDEKHNIVSEEKAYWVVIARYDDNEKLIEEIWGRPEKKSTNALRSKEGG